MTEQLKGEEVLKIGRRIVAFIGPEGSGKTTVALRLAEESNMPYVATGDIIRDLILNDPGELGEECRQMKINRTYLSGESLIRILLHRFSQEDARNGLILDGGLRTLEETVAFQEMLSRAGLELPMTVIYMQIPEWLSFDRLVTGENARKRDDDNIEGVASRLEKFNHQLNERLQIIEENPNWELVPVDATSHEDEVYCSVIEILKTLAV